jgi:hypothetical protein
MFKQICIAAALGIAPAGAALAHATQHHAKYTGSTAARSDASTIERCESLHYAEKISCLYSAHDARHAVNPLGTGGTHDTAGGAMSMSIPPTLLAQNGGATASSSSGSGSRIDAKPVEDLEAAAQRLRDAVHALAQTPAGPKRNEAIRQANRTLMEVQNALASLPPGVIMAAGNESEYKLAMDRLEMAAQRLRDAAHALAREPVGARRADAMKSINKALVDTQQVMLDLPLTKVQ